MSSIPFHSRIIFTLLQWMTCQIQSVPARAPSDESQIDQIPSAVPSMLAYLKSTAARTYFEGPPRGGGGAAVWPVKNGVLDTNAGQAWSSSEGSCGLLISIPPKRALSAQKLIC